MLLIYPPAGQITPVVLFKPELDLQISVEPKDFEVVKNLLNKDYATPKHQDSLWDDEYTLFNRVVTLPQTQYDKKHSKKHNVPIDFIVTIQGSPRDVYYKKTRRFLEQNKSVQWDYVNLKASFLGKPYSAYSAAKREWWNKYKSQIEAVIL